MNARTLDNDQVQLKKKCQNFLYPFLSPSLKNRFMYTKLNMIFYKFIMAEANSGPPKWQQYSPAGSGWSLLLPNPKPGGNEPSKHCVSIKSSMAQAKFIVTKKRCQRKGGEKMYICVDSRGKCPRQRAMTGHHDRFVSVRLVSGKTQDALAHVTVLVTGNTRHSSFINTTAGWVNLIVGAYLR